MILDEYVNVKLWGASFKYYNNLGYKGKCGDYIMVKTKDLTHGSNIKINVKCDKCGKESKIEFRSYVNNTKNFTLPYTCFDCCLFKQKETNIRKYGVDHVMKVVEIKEKYKQTCLENLNVESPLQLDKIKEKVHNTVLERYGVDYLLQNEEFSEKQKKTYEKTMIDRYGVKSPMQLETVKNKAIQTTLQRYGVTHVSKLDSTKEKMRDTWFKNYGVDNPMRSPEVMKKRYENGNMITSIQQLHINTLYNGELNYPISFYFADICFPDEKIVVEYNGGGHDLNVKMGKISKEEFDIKEIIRGKTLKSHGYKIMTIISSNDKLPSDGILLDMLNMAKDYLLNTEHTWIEFNIDENTIRNAANGISFFDYGELRKIKTEKAS